MDRLGTQGDAERGACGSKKAVRRSGGARHYANVPIDNSATEREFQNVAKLRLNVLFAGSTAGAHRACVLRVLLVAVLALTACRGVSPTPPVPCAGAGRLGEARHPIVSGLAVLGDHLYVASHDVFIPMRYRTPGAVEQLPRCGGDATPVSPADEDNPEGIVASERWVHWRADNHDATGTSRSLLLRSWTRAGVARVTREFENRQGRLSGPVLAFGALCWLVSWAPTAELETSAEDSTAVSRYARFDLPAHVNSTSLYASGDRLVRVTRTPPLAGVSTLDAAARQVELWSLRYDSVVLGVSDDQLYFQEYDEAAGRLEVRRRALQPGAKPELLYLPEGRAEVGLVRPGALYAAERKRLVRVALADGGVTVLRELDPEREQVTALAHDGDARLYFGLGAPFGGERAQLWALDESAGP